MDDKIKQIVKNTFIYIKTNHLELTPESYTKVFCTQARLLNIDIDECNWFHLWINKFDASIKKEINNYPIKTKDDFINVLSNICNNNTKSTNTIKTLDKALKILHNNNIIDIDIHSPLALIDTKLSKILENLDKNKLDSNKISTKFKPTSLLSKMELQLALEKRHKDDFVLVCDICCFDEIRLRFGSDALNKLFDAFYNILLDNALDGEIIGIYNETSIIIAPMEYNLAKAKIYADKIKAIIDKSAFIYKNQDINIKIDINIVQIKELK
ncbi:hypothetical protein CCY99_04455 [Helicobacter sp. 16-1353]|uniref:diguanylate cyclase domain-containing protein n=1 Tax=Helicobacter sp. 16-1353 TaxID=2004996 RepID=UPI000DCD0E9F|nr:diguanylate cyclase [Helicobacter sp. 16-1353]RAX54268.1 hypothetical protein CCY99_04455 [Helicobacter sp. 16-1353]